MKLDPKSINVRSLPSVPLEDKKMLPKIPGIYFAIDRQGIVQYIGRSANLNQRWLQHHRQSDLESGDRVSIAWLEINDSSLLDQIEQALIDYFHLIKVVRPQKKS
jgi:excinuclease UvrABC nuclease subunit